MGILHIVRHMPVVGRQVYLQVEMEIKVWVYYI